MRSPPRCPLPRAMAPQDEGVVSQAVIFNAHLPE